MLGELRTALNLAQMLPALALARRESARFAAASPIVVLPGFGADDTSTLPLRHFLRRKGFSGVVEGWGLGMNRAGLDKPHTPADLSPGWRMQLEATRSYFGEGGVAWLADRMVERVAQRSAELGRPITLIGWSLGGTIAREVARDLPQAVDRVITMGSPVIGGPKYTAASRILRARGLDLDWIEREVERRNERPIQQPITSIYSRSDAIVHWRAAIDHVSPRVRHIEVRAPHIGMGFNPAIWALVLEALAAPAGMTH